MLVGRRKIFGIKDPQRIFDQKLIEELEAHMKWPRYASYTEDKEICQEKWDLKYDDVRAIFLDNTNMFFCSNPVPQNYKESATHSITRITAQRKAYSFSPVDG